MAYEVFTRKTPRMGNPVVSFSKIGQIAFNQYAARQLQKAGVEFVLLMWDPEERKIGIKTAGEKDPRAYRVRYNDKGNGASFSAKTFLDFIGVDYSERKAIPVEIDATTELIVEVNVPDSFFAKKSALV
jgi:sugar/nucleoside kinase (ribokinase family)